VKQADLRDMFKKASNSVCTSTVVIFPDLTPSTSSAIKTPENPEEDPEPADEGDLQMEYSSN
jgi:hypothetical protein